MPIPFYIYDNPYGFRLNINHPQVIELMKRYCIWKSIDLWALIHYAEIRKDFERIVITGKEKMENDNSNGQKNNRENE